MIGILIVSHGKLAQAFKSSAEIIFGQAENIDYLGLYPEDDINNFNEKIKEKIINLDKGGGVIVFTDLISASPYTQSQIAISKLENNEKISLIGNLNFQMLIQAINGQVLEENIDQVVKNILEITKQEVLEWKYEKTQTENTDEEDDDDF
ncbi:PTS sugar transporter subunit IIA [Anaerococcus vaginalis]|uniref:PTS sugar transporter subunit IIA n=1 Tax=Anaerococcus vaginalis TaxID=33037 RepID=UPI0029130386|nr:PTS sugar transporter subunit IIA [Anaerococcus vaginalis]MDU5252332.1 PTS sugar transporter subunit IIA [Anaerococcus vaginalis]MDU6781538.1 PTS sugar transporter subunit IIA [Anaerococcus vaginalis]